MIDNVSYDLFLAALRALFLTAIPIVAGGLAGGVLAGVLQGVTTVRDPSIGYAARLVAVIAVLYLMFADIERAIMDLFRQAFH